MAHTTPVFILMKYYKKRSKMLFVFQDYGTDLPSKLLYPILKIGSMFVHTLYTFNMVWYTGGSVGCVE